MLYLVRKLEQSIVINNDIQITVVEIGRNSIKLGFTFPQSTTVLRKEVFDAMQRENLQALESFNDENLK